jgi:predicted Ser/Thr protein kinase
METEAKTAVCPHCNGPLPKGVLEGLCPACLMGQATDTDTGSRPGGRFEPLPAAEIARLFPQLKVLNLIGAGGMGAVYKAHQPGLDRFVALKILPPHGEGAADFGERFNREARALARLSHPNIVTVHEFGQVSGMHYFIMEYVDGANLRQLEQNGRLSPREALQIIPQICDALQYAHDEGVVHRDIKPENVLVDRKGRVKIADFGLAKLLSIDEGTQRLTAEGQVMGTPHYMAPEQVERPLSVDHRADIYSLGVVFYEMLTGDLPLGKFLPPSGKVAVDIRLDEVVLRALENDPARRYQRASEVKSRVETIAQSPGSSGPSGEGSAPANVAAAKPEERYVRWAGIALAVDRDGDREITWEGGLRAVTIGALLAAGGLYLFEWVTGRQSPGFLGIPSLIAIFTLGAGFRWALKAPLPDQKPEGHAAGATGFLGRVRNRLVLSYFALGSITVSVFAWCMFVEFGIPSIRELLRGTTTSQSAQRDPGTGVLFANLAGGGKAEVLAVSYPDAGLHQWWRPDGSTVLGETFKLENVGQVLSEGITNRDLVLRVFGLTNDASGPQIEMDPQLASRTVPRCCRTSDRFRVETAFALI